MSDVARIELNEGEVLAGKYRIERVLGQGGMGIVVAATHLQLGERVALKFLLPQALSNPLAVERFAREARAAVKIKSEHVARVSDVGTLESGAPYMVMEFLEALEFVLQACEAIAEAHALGIVHRDLKPANLFVVERADGVLSVKVLDFGISKVTESDGSGTMTATSAVMGSPYYMSPEQMGSTRDTDARADIWALGVVLHELLTGNYPFQANAMPELVLKIAMSPAVRLSAALPGAPVALEKVILKCLEKDRGQRYSTIGALAVALLEFAPRRSKASVERISGIMRRAAMSATAFELPPSSDAVEATVRSASDATQPSWGQTAPPIAKGTRARWALVGSIALAGLATAGYKWSHLYFAAPPPLTMGSAATPARPPIAISEPTAAPQTVPATVSPAVATPMMEAAKSPAPSASAPVRAPKKPARAIGFEARAASPKAASAPEGSPMETPPASAKLPANPLKMKIE